MKLETRSYTSKVASIIRELRQQFYEKYHVPPNYIKIPDWINTELKEERKNIFPDINGGIATFMGLQLCPTVEALSFDDIEVF